MTERVIWKYWETRGIKPTYIDFISEKLANKTSARIVTVTKETLADYLPNLNPGIFNVEEMAHKADLIRTRLVEKYGGMWLDSDAVVLKNIDHLFDYLDDYSFVGFNDGASLSGNSKVRVNCFLSRPDGVVIKSWVARQEEILKTKLKFSWTEIGSDILHPLCQKNCDQVKILDFKLIAPIPWNQRERFYDVNELDGYIDDNTLMMMLHNKLVSDEIKRTPVAELVSSSTVLGQLLRYEDKTSSRLPSIHLM
ncbi:MAG: hypothetical protein JXR76_01685 [Deltaproteobacteria bacterium]|nr:hypothetical protein [Deltaproteobacteria bacterium]